MQNAIALLDCNNFYASCERVFDASVKEKPIVVLSNNDGCVIAGSNEAKQIGITMGSPLFKLLDLLETHDAEIFSSNYALYGDMSGRVMNLSQNDLLLESSITLNNFLTNEGFLYLCNLSDKVLFNLEVGLNNANY